MNRVADFLSLILVGFLAAGYKKKGITRPRFQRALDELIEKGFIDIAHQGGGYDGDSSKYAISERWKDYGTDRFKVKSRKKDTRQGRGFAVVHDRERERQEELKLQPRRKRQRLVKSKSSNTHNTAPSTTHNTALKNSSNA